MDRKQFVIHADARLGGEAMADLAEEAGVAWDDVPSYRRVVEELSRSYVEASFLLRRLRRVARQQPAEELLAEVDAFLGGS